MDSNGVRVFMRDRLILLVVAIMLVACGSPEVRNEQHAFTGKTMGTTYSITCLSCDVSQPQIDSILEEVNLSLSTYIDTSLISTINRSSDSIFQLKADDVLTGYFVDNFILASEINELSGGAFDPTVMPLVNLWGFGYSERDRSSYPDSAKVDSVRALVGMSNFHLRRDSGMFVMTKRVPGAALDFSAVAKGYGVDVIGEHLELQGCENYMVEIGGEVRCRGMSPRMDPWRIGVTVPRPGASARDITLLTPLEDRSLATSGNYRNFYEVDGRMVSHSIDPETGYPGVNALLSASVMADNCATADALATSCMVLGLEGAKELIDRLDGVEAYLIFGDENGEFESWRSNGFPQSEQIE